MGKVAKSQMASEDLICDLSFLLDNIRNSNLDEIVPLLHKKLRKVTTCQGFSHDEILTLCDCSVKYVYEVSNLASEMVNNQINDDRLKYYLRVISDIANVSSIKNIFIEQIAGRLFEIVCDPSSNIFCARAILKMFNTCLIKSNKDIRRKIISQNNLMHLYKLVDLLGICGDYELQVCILETIIRMCSRQQIEEYSTQLFPEAVELQQRFLEIESVQFEVKVRKFLNFLNQKASYVVSLLAKTILMDTFQVKKVPEFIDGLWVDFNLTGSNVSFYCDATSLARSPSSVEASNDQPNELITILVQDVSSVYVKRFENFIQLTLTLMSPCLTNLETSKAAAKVNKICMFFADDSATQNLLSVTLPTMFADKLHLSQNLPSSHFESTEKELEKVEEMHQRENSKICVFLKQRISVTSSSPDVSLLSQNLPSSYYESTEKELKEVEKMQQRENSRICVSHKQKKSVTSSSPDVSLISTVQDVYILSSNSSDEDNKKTENMHLPLHKLYVPRYSEKSVCLSESSETTRLSANMEYTEFEKSKKSLCRRISTVSSMTFNPVQILGDETRLENEDSHVLDESTTESYLSQQENKTEEENSCRMQRSVELNPELKFGQSTSIITETENYNREAVTDFNDLENVQTSDDYYTAPIIEYENVCEVFNIQRVDDICSTEYYTPPQLNNDGKNNAKNEGDDNNNGDVESGLIRIVRYKAIVPSGEKNILNKKIEAENKIKFDDSAENVRSNGHKESIILNNIPEIEEVKDIANGILNTDLNNKVKSIDPSEIDNVKCLRMDDELVNKNKCVIDIEQINRCQKQQFSGSVYFQAEHALGTALSHDAFVDAELALDDISTVQKQKCVDKSNKIKDLSKAKYYSDTIDLEVRSKVPVQVHIDDQEENRQNTEISHVDLTQSISTASGKEALKNIGRGINKENIFDFGHSPETVDLEADRILANLSAPQHILNNINQEKKESKTVTKSNNQCTEHSKTTDFSEKVDHEANDNISTVDEQKCMKRNANKHVEVERSRIYDAINSDDDTPELGNDEISVHKSKEELSDLASIENDVKSVADLIAFTQTCVLSSSRDNTSVKNKAKRSKTKVTTRNVEKKSKVVKKDPKKSKNKKSFVKEMNEGASADVQPDEPNKRNLRHVVSVRQASNTNATSKTVHFSKQDSNKVEDSKTKTMKQKVKNYKKAKNQVNHDTIENETRSGVYRNLRSRQPVSEFNINQSSQKEQEANTMMAAESILQSVENIQPERNKNQKYVPKKSKVLGKIRNSATTETDGQALKNVVVPESVSAQPCESISTKPSTNKASENLKTILLESNEEHICKKDIMDALGKTSENIIGLNKTEKCPSQESITDSRKVLSEKLNLSSNKKDICEILNDGKSENLNKIESSQHIQDVLIDKEKLTIEEISTEEFTPSHDAVIMSEITNITMIHEEYNIVHECLSRILTQNDDLNKIEIEGEHAPEKEVGILESHVKDKKLQKNDIDTSVVPRELELPLGVGECTIYSKNTETDKSLVEKGSSAMLGKANTKEIENILLNKQEVEHTEIVRDEHYKKVLKERTDKLAKKSNICKKVTKKNYTKLDTANTKEIGWMPLIKQEIKHKEIVGDKYNTEVLMEIPEEKQEKFSKETNGSKIITKEPAFVPTTLNNEDDVKQSERGITKHKSILKKHELLKDHLQQTKSIYGSNKSDMTEMTFQSTASKKRKLFNPNDTSYLATLSTKDKIISKTTLFSQFQTVIEKGTSEDGQQPMKSPRLSHLKEKEQEQINTASRIIMDKSSKKHRLGNEKMGKKMQDLLKRPREKKQKNSNFSTGMSKHKVSSRKAKLNATWNNQYGMPLGAETLFRAFTEFARERRFVEVDEKYRMACKYPPPNFQNKKYSKRNGRDESRNKSHYRSLKVAVSTAKSDSNAKRSLNKNFGITKESKIPPNKRIKVIANIRLPPEKLNNLDQSTESYYNNNKISDWVSDGNKRHKE